LRFGGANFPRLRGRFASDAALTAIEIEENDLITTCGEAGSDAATAIFGVAGMAAGDDDFQLAGLRGKWGERGKKTSGLSE
jgi:hypothetical protein